MTNARSKQPFSFCSVVVVGSLSKISACPLQQNLIAIVLQFQLHARQHQLHSTEAGRLRYLGRSGTDPPIIIDPDLRITFHKSPQPSSEHTRAKS